MVIKIEFTPFSHSPDCKMFKKRDSRRFEADKKSGRGHTRLGLGHVPLTGPGQISKGTHQIFRCQKNPLEVKCLYQTQQSAITEPPIDDSSSSASMIGSAGIS